MASRTKKRASEPAATETTSTPAAAEAPKAATPAKKAKTARKRATRPAKRAKRVRAARPKAAKKKAVTKSTSKKRAPKKAAAPRRYTPAERAKILAAAKSEGLSGPAAAKKFGISQLTFYSWRKKAGAGTSKVGRAGRPKATGGQGRLLGDVGDQIRLEIQSRVREMLPEIVRHEIDAVLGSGSPRRKRR